MKIAYQVILGDAVKGTSIGRNVWFSDAEQAMTESYLLMERVEEKYGSFLIWDAGIPFKSDKKKNRINILEGIMPGVTTKEKPFYLQIIREQVPDWFEFDEPNQPKAPLSDIQEILRKNIGRYFKKMEKSELRTYKRED